MCFNSNVQVIWNKIVNEVNEKFTSAIIVCAKVADMKDNIKKNLKNFNNKCLLKSKKNIISCIMTETWEIF